MVAKSSSKNKINFWIVTPCWKRPEITEFIFREFLWAKNQTKSYLNLNIVAVGEGPNLKIAKKYRFHTVNRDNKFLGRKFNDGYEYAFRHGANLAIPIGSDSWVHPDIFIHTSKVWRDNGSIFYSTKHAMISETGLTLGLITSPPRNNEYNKCALLFYPRSLMAACNFRPCNEKQKKSCDRSTIENILRRRKDAKFVKNADVNDLQYLAFKNKEVQIWKYKDYKAQFRKQHANPWQIIQKHYPGELTKYARSYYGV